jgi:hypothetical protein
LLEDTMLHNRSFPVLYGVGSAAVLALPILLSPYVSRQRSSIELPSYHASDSGPNWVVAPVSNRTAQAVRDFKTTQI